MTKVNGACPIFDLVPLRPGLRRRTRFVKSLISIYFIRTRKRSLGWSSGHPAASSTIVARRICLGAPWTRLSDADTRSRSPHSAPPSTPQVGAIVSD
jgi:hypothetical protein